MAIPFRTIAFPRPVPQSAPGPRQGGTADRQGTTMISGQRESVRSGSFSRPTAADMCEPIHFLLQGHDRLRAVAGMISLLADALLHRGRECYAHGVLEFFNDRTPEKR